MDSGEKLRIGTKLGFGVGGIAEGAIYIAFNTWNFLFYNQVLGLSGTLAGLAVTISLLLDAIADPVVGSITDRWRSKLGRRHPFLYASALPLALSFYLLYVPPSGLSGVPLFLWFTFFATIHRQALTLYQVPHLALGAELSSDYHQRSVVLAYGALFGVLGGTITAFFGWTLFSKVPGGTTVRTGYPIMAAGVAIIAALAILISAHTTRDQIPRLIQPKFQHERFGLRRMLSEIRDCMSNRNYLVLLIGMFFVSATLGTRETLLSYTSLFFWELPADKIRLFSLAIAPANIVAFFLAVGMHRRFDKRNTIVAALLMIVFAGSAPVLGRLAGVMPANHAPGLLGILLLSTSVVYLAFAVLTISALSALADIADEHELNTGRRQEGVFFAARTFFAKLSSGFGHIIAGAALDLIHFPAGAKPGQVAHDVVVALGVIEGPVATIPTAIAIFFYAAYNIDRQKHARIQSELAERRKRTSAPPESIPPAAIPAAEPASF